MIEMALSRIVMREHHDEVVIHLRERDGARTFPVVIGLYEAAEIKRKVMNHRTQRPLTHDLLRNVIHALGGELVCIIIDALSQGIFFAKLKVRINGEEKKVDARSSDAIAIAIAAKVPIFVEESVLNEADASPGPGSDPGPKPDPDENFDFE